ncbi:MAG: LacI family DNA-binding transcriptional regulator [Chthoniobacterales bacterium]
MSSPTLADVAKKASVAVSTASIVLSESGQFHEISEPTRKRIQAAAHELKYQVYAGGRQLKRGRSGMIALLLSAEKDRSSLNLDLLYALCAELQQRDLGLSFVRMDDESLMGRVPRFLRQREVDGVLVNYNVNISRHLIDLIHHYEIPTVFMNTRKVRGAVYFDHYRAAIQAVERLAALGHRRIMFLNFGTQFEHYSVSDTVKGYLAAMKRLGLKPLLRETVIQRPDRLRAALKLLSEKRRPTAIFTMWESSAIPVVQAAETLGIRIPKDLSICTVGTAETLRGISPQPAYIFLPWEDSAKAAVEILLNKIEKKSDKSLTGRVQCGWRNDEETIGPVENG